TVQSHRDFITGAFSYTAFNRIADETTGHAPEYRGDRTTAATTESTACTTAHSSASHRTYACTGLGLDHKLSHVQYGAGVGHPHTLRLARRSPVAGRGLVGTTGTRRDTQQPDGGQWHTGTASTFYRCHDGSEYKNIR